MKQTVRLLALYAAAGLPVGLAATWAARHYTLAHPWALLGLVVPLLLGGLRLVQVATGRQVAVQLNHDRPVGASGSSREGAPESAKGRPRLRRGLMQLLPEVPGALRLMAMGLLVIAAARPQSATRLENLTREGIDLVLSMDVSVSMLSQDLRPNRLEASKEVAMEFIEDRPYDRIALVAYEGEAFTQVPLTTDHRVVLNGVTSLQPGLLEPGTAVGMGLATAINRLKDSDAKSKVVILLTDGESNAGAIAPTDAAQLARLQDIRVYTIGVGTIGKARTPVAKVGNQYEYDWREVKIDEATLKAIAETTGGRYFRATSKDKLTDIYAEIDALEKTRFNVMQYNQKTEEFEGFVGASIFLLLLEFLLRTVFVRSLI